MTRISKSIEIDAPVAEVFEFFSNPDNLPEIWPSMLEVSNVERRGEPGGGFDWVYKMAGLRFRGHSETVEWKENEKVVTKSKEGIPNTFTYTYEDLEGRCRLTTEVEYEIPHKVLSKLAEPFVRRLNEHDAEVLMHNLKARMELGREAQAEERAAEQPEAQPPA